MAKPTIKSKAEVKEAIKSIANRGKRLDRDIHKAAVQCIMHGQAHGDFTLATDLVDAMPKSSRRKSLIAWFEHFAPMLYTKSDAEGAGNVNVFKKNKHAGAPAFDVEGADDAPFYDKFMEAAPILIGVEKVDGAIVSIINRIEKAEAEGRIEDGDEAGVKARLAALKKLEEVMKGAAA